ncbi:hypothetical protein [Aquabacterium sp. A08]|uniref:hypothetical protein n=1 Tax=Aquabacterium sp. A08 TaxID=2718532 RepID=UPI001420BC18|nr:hypothetical protein [Aquabacterium sp. A08]NIC41788.1 hypothetical protein [Aquabacterium sp. A08]
MAIINGSNGVDDTLVGTDGNDTIDGKTGADTITGGLGDDLLYGGNGAFSDTFVFNFTVSSKTITTTTTETIDLLFRDGNTPNEANADAVAWNNYVKQLEAWRAELEALGFTDENIETETAFITTSTKKTTLTKEYEWDNSFVGSRDVEVTETVNTITGEGNDKIYQWGVANTADKLKFVGLSSDAEAVNYWDTWLNSEVVGNDTKITFDGGSITLIGVTTTIEALVADGYVTFA